MLSLHLLSVRAANSPYVVSRVVSCSTFVRHLPSCVLSRRKRNNVWCGSCKKAYEWACPRHQSSQESIEMPTIPSQQQGQQPSHTPAPNSGGGYGGTTSAVWDVAMLRAVLNLPTGANTPSSTCSGRQWCSYKPSLIVTISVLNPSTGSPIPKDIDTATPTDFIGIGECIFVTQSRRS